MGDKIVHINPDNFNELINGDTPVIIDFWAQWCRPCLAIAPLFEQLSERYEGRMIFAKLNTDHHPQIAGALGISSIPTFMIMRNGQVIARWVGAHPNKLKQMVDQYAL